MQIHSRPRKCLTYLTHMILPLQRARDLFWILASLASRSVDAVLRAQKLAAVLPKMTWYTGDCDIVRWRHALAIIPRPRGRHTMQVQITS